MAPIKGDVLHVAVTIFLLIILFGFILPTNGINYSRDELFNLNSDVFKNSRNWNETYFSSSVRDSRHSDQNNRSMAPRRKRGSRGGHLVKSRKRFSNTPLPTIILANVNRLFNKYEELFSRIDNDKNFSNSQVICYTETWLKDEHPDSLVKPHGFDIFRLDRDLVETQKEDGGGVCFFINQMWCSNVKVVNKKCTKDLECISIKCRPFFLPREFSSITLTGVYIHPKANTTLALRDLRDIITHLENADPDTVSIILGDFNQANLRHNMPNLKQHVTCPTRGANTLDHCYCKLKDAYKSHARSALGNSDHNSVLLVPTHKQKSKQSAPVTQSVQSWSESAVSRLNNCLDTTDWNVFKDTCVDINDLTYTVCSYINFCIDNCIPTRNVTRHNNNKVWFDRDLKKKMIKKDITYKNKANDPLSYKAAKKDLRSAIKKKKSVHKKKLEEAFDTKDAKRMWGNISKVTNYKARRDPWTQTTRRCPTDLTTFMLGLTETTRRRQHPCPFLRTSRHPSSYQIMMFAVCSKDKKLQKLQDLTVLSQNFLDIVAMR